MSETSNPILKVRDLEVKFRVRNKELTAIRKVSLDLYENETLAIVGESGSGKTVLTKTFTGMLFVELILRRLAPSSPKAFLTIAVSVGSFMGVEVPCAL